jgi:hypothetical protein
MRLTREDIKIINDNIKNIQNIEEELNKINNICEQIATNDCGMEFALDIVNFDRPLEKPPLPTEEIGLGQPNEFMSYTYSVPKMPDAFKEVLKKQSDFETSFVEFNVNTKLSLNVLALVTKSMKKDRDKMVKLLKKKYDIDYENE